MLDNPTYIKNIQYEIILLVRSKRCQFWLPAELYVCVFSNSVLHLFIKAAMVSKVMMAVHQGVSSNAGRSLKEIEVNIGEEG